MRIISGRYGRRRFTVPSNFKLRPTTDLAKEALFNTLTSEYDLEETSVLDLFSGTGSIGVEFCSRGAQYVCAVEQNRKHSAFIRQVIDELNIAKGTFDIYTSDVRSFINRKVVDRKFDFVFADPPYNLSWLSSLPELITSSSLLSPDVVFVLEHPSEYNFSSFSGFIKHKSYSAVNYSFFQFTNN